MKQLIIPAFGLDNLAFRDVPEPQPGRGEVLVEVKAVALNYRDLLVAKGLYNAKMPLPRVPCSDAAGVVIALGANVTEVKVGDRVCGTFFQSWDNGPITEYAAKSALGGANEGVLAERIVLNERGVVPMPDYLSFDEAATLPCAAVTAWNALANVRPGQSVLVQGTGGVSLFALQLAVANGVKVLITTSDNEKLEGIEGYSASTNYRDYPDWDKWAREQTGGVGVDLVVEVGGAGTLDRSVKAVRAGGEIALIGVLAGGSTFNPLPMMMKAITLRGIFVGSREMFLVMNEFLKQHELHPVIDEWFRFDKAPDAFRHLEKARHVGKVVIVRD